MEEEKKEVTEEVTQETNTAEVITETPKKGNKKVVKGKSLTVFIIVIVVLAMAIAFGCGYVLHDKLDNNKKEEPKQQEPKKDEPKKDEPTKDENLTYIDKTVENLNSDKNYEIQLVRKYEKPENDNYGDDGYKYGLYDKKNNKMLIEPKYENITCGNSCQADPNEFGCLETGMKLFSIKVGNKDYIYGTYKVNLCGGIDSNYFLYDVEANSIYDEGTGGSEKLEVNDGNLVISYNTAGDDICTDQGTAQLSCNGASGYIFASTGSFNPVVGKGSFKYGNNYAIVKYDVNLNPNMFSIELYDSTGNIINTISNCIAFDQNYVVTVNGKELQLLDIDGNKKGTFKATYDNSKYYYSPRLEEENGKETLSYTEKSGSGNQQKIYAEMN